SAKFVPSPSQLGPSGKGPPGQISGATKLHLPALEVGDDLDAAPAQPQHPALDADLRLPRQLVPEPEQAAVERELALVGLPGELRAEEGLRGLRVGHVLACER